jgi:pimeloyl-ACP methyl ester carboxylesterase
MVNLGIRKLNLQVSADETIFYSLIEGNDENCCLVFLHEGLGCTKMWNDFPERLCRMTGCPGLVYDRIGYGQSSSMIKDRTIHYLHDYALRELPHVIEAVIPGQTYVLIGHSDGGSISLIFGSENPPGLKGIVTEAAHVFVDAVTLAGIRVADEAFERGKFNRLIKYHGDKTRQLFKAWSDTWQKESFSHWNIEYMLPSIQCPVLVIQGVNDQYGTEDQVNSIVSKVAGRSEAIFVADCGHAPHREQPEIVLEKISYFVGKVNLP